MSEDKLKKKKEGKDLSKKTIKIGGKDVRLDQMDAEQALKLVDQLGIKIPQMPFMDKNFYLKFKTVREISETQEWKDIYSQFYEFDEYELEIDITETDVDVEEYDNERRFDELVKCADSFSYFCHKYIKILHPILGLIPLVMYKYQRRAIQCYENYRFNILSKFRQGGLTTTGVIWALWRCMFRKDQQIMVLSKTDREAMSAGDIVRIAIEKLPSWMKDGIGRLKEDSKHEKSFAETDSVVRFYTPEAARGKSATILIVDEAAFIKGMDEHWKSMYPVINTGGAAIIISTVNGIGNWYQETYYAAESGDNEFNIIEMDYWEHPDYVTPSWVRMTWANLGDKGWAQEILRSFLGSGETYIPATIIAQIGEFAKRSKPLRVLFKEWSNPSEKKMGWDQGGLWIWKQPIDGHEYIASCDCAEGVGNDGDNSCIEILDIGTLEQVAEFYSNSVPPHVFSQIAYQIGTYYNTALLVVETNGVGAAVGKALHQSLSYDNLYFDGTKKTTSSSPGIKATPQNRPVYLESFQHRVVNGTLRIFSRRVVKELETFMYNPATHRAEAQKRKHDDAILALSLALYVRDTYMTDIPVGAEVPEELTQIFNTDMFKKIQEEIIGEERSLWMKEEMPSIIMLPYVNDDETREDMIRLRRPHDLLLREFGW